MLMLMSKCEPGLSLTEIIKNKVLWKSSGVIIFILSLNLDVKQLHLKNSFFQGSVIPRVDMPCVITALCFVFVLVVDFFYYLGFRRRTRFIKCKPFLVAKLGFMVLSVPGVDRGS